MMKLHFEWDEEKDRQNIAKHGIGFELACRIFEGPVFTWTNERKDYGEIRQISIGVVEEVAFLTVAHTDRLGITRIIFARPASRKERNRYEQAVQENDER